MFIPNPNDKADDFDNRDTRSEQSVTASATASGEFNESQLQFIRRYNLQKKEYLSSEVPVMHQRGFAVSFLSELLEMFGIRRYDHQYDLDDSSLSLEASEEEQNTDEAALVDESTTCDLEKNYPVISDVSHGGQGTIVAAEDRQFGRRVALKTLKDPANEQRRSAFFAEARITAMLEHPAIVPIHNVYVDHENTPHLAMKYIEGKSYRERIANIKRKYIGLSWYKICALERWQRKLRIERFLRVCEAIEYAHNRNVLHRDIKPENIMVGRFGEVYVMDWGMAIVIPQGQDWVLTSASGTPRYIAPEVLTHRPYGRTADIYQLGLVLYETTFLRRAFPWKNRDVTKERVKAGELSPMVHYFGCYVPTTLKRIIRKATALDPLDRYQNVDDFSSDLRCFLKNEATSVERFPRWAKFQRLLSQHSLLLLALFFLMAVAAGGAILSNLKHQVTQKVTAELEDDTLKHIYASNMRTGIQVEREIVNVEDDLLMLCREAGARLTTLAKPNPSLHYYCGTTGSLDHPPGFEYQPTFGFEASFRAICWHVPRGETIPNLDSILSTLYPMLPSVRKLLTNHFRLEQNGRAPVADLSEERTPVVSTTLGFQNDLLFGFPYTGSRDPDYRVTKQDWYVRAVEDVTDRPVWTGPKVDAKVKDRILMGCSAPVYNTENEIIGAAVTMVEPAAILKLYAQKLTDSPEVRAHYLVHFSGDVYATDLAELKPTVQTGDDGEARIRYKAFPNPEKFTKMWELRTGRLFQGEHHQTLYIFVRIEPIKCVYIEEIDFTQAMQMQTSQDE